VIKRSLALGMAMAVCAAAEAAEPPVAPTASTPPAASIARPAPKLTKPLDLRIRDVRFYMMPNEYRAALGAPDADRNTVVVEANRELLPVKYEEPVPGGIVGVFWALKNPTQSWRLLTPDLNRPPPGPPDVVPPPIFRWGP
jgi:hypothetical protein